MIGATTVVTVTGTVAGAFQADGADDGIAAPIVEHGFQLVPNSFTGSVGVFATWDGTNFVQVQLKDQVGATALSVSTAGRYSTELARSAKAVELRVVVTTGSVAVTPWTLRQA